MIIRIYLASLIILILTISSQYDRTKKQWDEVASMFMAFPFVGKVVSSICIAACLPLFAIVSISSLIVSIVNKILILGGK